MSFLLRLIDFVELRELEPASRRSCIVDGGTSKARAAFEMVINCFVLYASIALWSNNSPLMH